MLSPSSKTQLRTLKKEHNQLLALMPLASSPIQGEWTALEEKWQAYIGIIRSIAHDELLAHGDKEALLDSLSADLTARYQVMQRVLH